MWRSDPLVGYRNKSHFRGHAWHFVPVQTNSFGFRGPEFATQKPEHTYRVLGLGDSITWGVGVRDEDTYLRILESNLNRRTSAASGVRFESINAGVVGYSTYQELLVLKRDGLPLCPDLVTVGYTPNDFYPTEDPFHNVPLFHKPVKPGVQRRPPYQATPPRFHFFAFLGSVVPRQIYRLNRFVRDTLRPIRDGLFGKPVMSPSPDEWAAGSFEYEAWPILEEQVREMKRLRDEYGFRLQFILFHNDRSDVSSPQGPHTAFRRMKEFLLHEKIEYLDLTEEFRGHEDDYFVDSMHLSPAGHRVVAQAVERYMQPAGWTPRACPAEPLNPRE